MKFSLIICTYMRPQPVLQLLQSVKEQTFYPDEILIVDGSLNTDTQSILQEHQFPKLKYFLVEESHRGLTKQRNFGIQSAAKEIEIICFLDDDTILEPTYFEEILKAYQQFPEALGVGGYITNESQWTFVGNPYKPTIKEFYYDGWKVKEGSRFVLRKRLGLDSDQPPGYSSDFSHGRSIGFLPPSNAIYPTELLMGGVSSFRKRVLDEHKFSTYFEGYGLYEDADFTLRISKIGPLYVTTAARLGHFHAPSGRPNQLEYGKMVVRNGWYVWRVKNPNPLKIHKIKWHSITLLLLFLRLSNTFTTPKKKQAFTEAIGRMIGWLSLFYDEPRLDEDKRGNFRNK